MIEIIYYYYYYYSNHRNQLIQMCMLEDAYHYRNTELKVQFHTIIFHLRHQKDSRLEEIINVEHDYKKLAFIRLVDSKQSYKGNEDSKSPTRTVFESTQPPNISKQRPRSLKLYNNLVRTKSELEVNSSNTFSY